MRRRRTPVSASERISRKGLRMTARIKSSDRQVGNQEEDSLSERLEDRLKRARPVPAALSVAPCAVSAVTASRFYRCADTEVHTHL
jgi:hypothetical protein